MILKYIGIVCLSAVFCLGLNSATNQNVDAKCMVSSFNADRPVDPNQVAELNKALVELLKQFNNETTQGSVTFNNVETNETRAVAVDVSAFLSKQGPKDKASVDIKKVDYQFPVAPCSVPVFTGEAEAKFNLLNVMDQATINKMGPDADKLILDLAKDARDQFGDAITLAAKITHKDYEDQDPKKNLLGVGLEIEAHIDLTKLPASKKAEDVQFTDGKVSVDITLHGAKVYANVQLNPLANAFKRDQVGLKEYLDKILARDPQTLQNIVDYMEEIYHFADNATTDQGTSPNR